MACVAEVDAQVDHGPGGARLGDQQARRGERSGLAAGLQPGPQAGEQPLGQ